MTSTVDPRAGVIAGILTITATVFAMALTDAVVKFSSADMTLWQLYVLRSLLVIPLLLLYRRARLWPQRLGWILLRSLALVLMYLGIYAAIPLLDLSVVAAALYTGPLFILLLSALFLNESVTLRHWLAIVLGFIGVLLIIRPTATSFTPLSLVPLCAALLYAIAAVITRAKCVRIPALSLALWLNISLFVVGCLASLVIAVSTIGERFNYPFLFAGWSPMKGHNWPLVIVLALLILAVSIGLAKAYQAPQPQLIAAFDYSYLLFATFWGFVFFGERPDAMTLTGMVLIALAGLTALMASLKPT